MSVIATKDIKKGEELSVSYVDVSQGNGESVPDARRRRRMEIARGWRMACPCERCSEEAPADEAINGSPEIVDGSTIEEAARRFEEGFTEPSGNLPLD